MRTVEARSDGLWKIVDDGRTLFTGDRDQVEDWLDRQENLAREVRSAGLGARLRHLSAKLLVSRSAGLVPKS